MIHRLWRLLNLREGADIPGTIQAIEANVALRGSILWILGCAALLACIGLDTNSTTVIIGAMLISPLMGPVLGIGLGLGLNDWTLFWQGLRQLGLATLLSLGTSVLYFSLTPLGEPTPELLAFTHPTLFDVLIAFFGGVVGIVSNSRAQKTNAIPGVAIATTLMLPLCTAGFGLARLDWAIVFGALYLFWIIPAFISLATYLLSRLMRFPQREYERPERRRRATFILGAMLLLITAPSVYFLVEVYRQERERRIVQAEVVERLQQAGNEVLKWSVDRADSVRLVRVYLSGRPITPAEVQALEQQLRRRRLPHYRVAVTRVNMSKEEVAQLSQEAAQNLLNRMQLDAETRRPPQVQTTSAPAGAALPPPAQLLREVRTVFPAVQSLSLGRLQSTARPDSLQPDTLLTVAVRWPAADSGQQRRLYALLRARLRQDSLVLLRN